MAPGRASEMMTMRSALVLGAMVLSACSGNEARSKGVTVSDASAESGPDGAPAIDGSKGPDAADGGFEAGLVPNSAVLSATGLFTDVKSETLAPGVRPFQPKYVLWSDGATKRRWLYLPPGERIDTSDMDYWKYPVGTKVWKEFTVNGVRVETRLQYKAGPNKSDWVMMAYQWRDDLSDADAVPDGVQNARGTPHDIPRTTDCQFCHGNMKDSLLGVTAIQLSHSLPGVTLTDLVSENRLSNPPSGPFTIPGSSVAEGALGYLHANCGSCHNSTAAISQFIGLRLWESTTALDTVEHTTAYRSAVGQLNGVLPEYHIIEPGYPDLSEMVLRMNTRGTASPTQMPPLGTEIVDTVGVAAVRTWIASLPPIIRDGGADAGGFDAASTDSSLRDAAADGG